MNHSIGEIFRSKAPLRISLSGGGTDVSPFPETEGGVVLSVTINHYAFVTLVPLDTDEIRIRSLDYDIVAKYNSDEEILPEGKLPLVKAVIERLSPGKGYELFMHTDAPPGSGLGSSSTIIVALLGVFKEYLRLPMTDYELAELAYSIEREDLGITGGRQDQYAAVFGGVNFIEFNKSGTIVNPLRIKRSVLNELEYNLLLCYTGETRLSANIVKRQTESFIRRDPAVTEGLRNLKSITYEMKNALLRGDVLKVGLMLDDAWRSKRMLDSSITNKSIDRLHEAAMSEGALGGKILGAGGGGYLLFFVPFHRRRAVAEILEKLGGQVVDFGFDLRGLQLWKGRIRGNGLA